MTWLINHKPAYDTAFVELPKSLQKQATQAHAELEQDPTTLTFRAYRGPNPSPPNIKIPPILPTST
jgi:hypothetical protein